MRLYNKNIEYSNCVYTEERRQGEGSNQNDYLDFTRIDAPGTTNISVIGQEGQEDDVNTSEVVEVEIFGENSEDKDLNDDVDVEGA